MRALRVALACVLLQLSPVLGSTASRYTRWRKRLGRRSATAVPNMPAYECTTKTKSFSSSASMAAITSVMWVSKSIFGCNRCARSPTPVRVTAWARCPAAIRPGKTRCQHQAPCQAPCTNKKCAIKSPLCRAAHLAVQRPNPKPQARPPPCVVPAWAGASLGVQGSGSS